MVLEREYRSGSPQATEALGHALGGRLPAGTLLLLDGGLGAGKTCFVRGLARGLGVEERISSPTYALMQSYPARGGEFHHLDAWMEGRERAFLAEGGAELLAPPAISAIEWAERIEEFLPTPRLRIEIAPSDEHSRTLRMRVEGEGVLADALEAAISGLPPIPGISVISG